SKYCSRGPSRGTRVCRVLRSACWVFFFFQAEDGIRDWSVTGVQTCALPICLAAALAQHHLVVDQVEHALGVAGRLGVAGQVVLEIGRASCRERGEFSGGPDTCKVMN